MLDINVQEQFNHEVAKSYRVIGPPGVLLQPLLLPWVLLQPLLP
jgi:hypothetical protein